ncbi:glycosyltransferase family 9 protein [Egbenema bharatensis]|uniref:glycosyltransferase family 9 protein n=1 Tax=Egbenema bharatensis TaxID=3463334 RepID=UPI003A89B1AF
MRTHLDVNHQLTSLPHRILLVRSLPGLGDFLCLVPALRALRLALPEADIRLIGLQQTAGLVQRFQHYLNGWLSFPGCPGIPEVPFCAQRTIAFLTEIQSSEVDLALQLHGNGTHINSFTMLLGAKHTAGFFPPCHACPDPKSFFPYPDQEPEVWRPLRLLEFLGVPLQGDRLEFPLSPSDWQAFQKVASAFGLQEGNYVCIHPGASVVGRRWAVQRFATVADQLAKQGLQIVLTGTLSEQELTQAVAQAMQFPAIDLAGKTGLGAIAVLLKRARLLICNDTGVSHLADALQVPSVVIFTQSDPLRWGPLDRQLHRVVGSSLGDNENPLTPSPAMVLAEATDLLQQEIAYAS